MLVSLLAAAALAAPAHGFQVARPLHALALRSSPGGAVVARVGSRTPFGSPLVLGVGARRGRWVGLISSALPNGRLGWADRRRLRFQDVRYAISVDLSRRELVLRDGGLVVRRVTVAIGRPSSPTPTGRFTVTDKLAGGALARVYGCCILALSGHQPHPPPGWRGEARLAIHGGSMAGAVSAGCLHAPERDLRFLIATVPLGTPVRIRP